MAAPVTSRPWSWGNGPDAERRRSDWARLRRLLLRPRPIELRLRPSPDLYSPDQIRHFMRWESALSGGPDLTPPPQPLLEAWLRDSTLQVQWGLHKFPTPDQINPLLMKFEPRPPPTYTPPATPRDMWLPDGVPIVIAMVAVFGVMLKVAHSCILRVPILKMQRSDSDEWTTPNVMATNSAVRMSSESADVMADYEDSSEGSVEPPPTYWECTGVKQRDDPPPPYFVPRASTAPGPSDTTLTFENGRVLERPTTIEVTDSTEPVSDTSQPTPPTRGRVLLV